MTRVVGGARHISFMTIRFAAALAAPVLAVLLAGCVAEPLPTYSYYPVPCPPTVPVAAPQATAPPAAGAPPTAAAPTTLTAPPAAASAADCVEAVANGAYAEPYDPYWYDGSPYYGGAGFVGFVDGRFPHGFRDHHFHHGFRGGGFHDGGFHGFHGGGFHGGGFHGGGFHGGGFAGGHGR